MPVWLRAAVFIAIAPGTLAGWLPWWIADSPPMSGGPAARAVGAFFICLGWGVLLWCARDFARHGRGTPNPADPPRALVVDGLYHYVRNPMYVGLILAVLGQALMHHSMSVVWYAAVLAVGFHLRVVFYEEPKLRTLFGAEYLAYCARVHRWLPMLRVISDRSPRGAHQVR